MTWRLHHAHPGVPQTLIDGPARGLSLNVRPPPVGPHPAGAATAEAATTGASAADWASAAEWCDELTHLPVSAADAAFLFPVLLGREPKSPAERNPSEGTVLDLTKSILASDEFSAAVRVAQAHLELAQRAEQQVFVVARQKKTNSYI